MNRDVVAERNRKIARSLHRPTARHRIRRATLSLLTYLPVRTNAVTHPNRILLIRPDHLGDILLTTPAIRALRIALPEAEIHALVGHWSQDIVGAYDEIDHVLTLPFPAFTRAATSGKFAPYQLAYRHAQHLRQTGYNCAIIFRPDHWWGAMLAFWAGIPDRHGFDHPNTRMFLTKAVEHRHEHAVMQNMRLVEHWTGQIAPGDVDYCFPVTQLNQAWCDRLLKRLNIKSDDNLVCIHPGSGTLTKQWTDAQWAQVAEALRERSRATIVLTGSNAERGTTGRIASHMQQPAHNLAGETNIGQLAALYKRAKVVIGPDSGPLHLAAAVGTPTVALFGPADPVEFAPWGRANDHIVVTSGIGCRPCRILDWSHERADWHPCVHDISVTQVLDAIRTFL